MLLFCDSKKLSVGLCCFAVCGVVFFKGNAPMASRKLIGSLRFLVISEKIQADILGARWRFGSVQFTWYNLNFNLWSKRASSWNVDSLFLRFLHIQYVLWQLARNYLSKLCPVTFQEGAEGRYSLIQLYPYSAPALEGVGVSTNCRPLYPRETEPVPIVQEAGWTSWLSGWFQKISPPPDFEPGTLKPIARVS